MKTQMPSLFRAMAPRIMRDLIRDFDIRPRAAAAVLGNIGHECNGFRTMQEVKPVVPGSRGGYGWNQWTGPRRRAFEAWAKARGLKLDSYEANYGFMAHELRTAENAALRVLRGDHPLEKLVELFERAYLRAGVIHLDGRLRYARWAVEAFDAETRPANPKPLAKSRTMQGGGAAAGGGAAVVAQKTAEAVEQLEKADGYLQAGTAIGLVLGLLVLAGALYALYARWDDAGRPLPGWWPGASNDPA
jgi:hypothetical protein